MPTRLVAVALLLAALSSTARARADAPIVPPVPQLQPAPRMAEGSFTLLAAAQVTPTPAAPLQLGVDVLARIVPVRGFAIQPRVGVGFAGTVAGAAYTGVVRIGAGAGWITALGAQIAMVLSAGYDLVALVGFDSSLVAHRFTAELALPVVIDHGVIEPFFQLGASVVGNGADVALGLGVRGGATW